jgi:UDP:flavonoid glycosyltransferase YjiC (YdhE family)
MGALVHACGIGTLSEAVMSGVPSVGVPVFGEQKFIAAWAHRRGLVPRPCMAASVTADRLHAMISRVLDQTAFRSRTAVIAKAMRKEQGAQRACSFIEELIGPRSARPVVSDAVHA